MHFVFVFSTVCNIHIVHITYIMGTIQYNTYSKHYSYVRGALCARESLFVLYSVYTEEEEYWPVSCLFTISSKRHRMLVRLRKAKEAEKIENEIYKKRVKKWMTRFVDDADAPLYTFTYIHRTKFHYKQNIA